MRHRLAAALLLAACAGAGRQTGSTDAPVPATVSREHLRALQWLEGRWATERNAYLTTYLEFTFTSDTSLQLRLFESRAFTDPYNTFALAMTGGRLLARSGSREWLATRLDSTGVRFVSTGGDVYEGLAIRRLDPDRARIEIRWRFESGQAETRTVTARRVPR